MSYFLVAVVVLGAGFLAGGLAWTARTMFRLEALRQHHEIGSAVFLQLGVIYAVLLAFVFSEVWGEYNTAADALSRECGSLHDVALLANALPPDERDQITVGLRTYLRAVIAEEWPAMESRNRGEAAQRAFAALVTTVAGRDASSPPDNATRSQLVAEVADAHRWRETRLFQMTLHVPGLLWALVIGLGLVLVGFLLCFGIEYVVSQVIFTAIFAASIAMVLALVRCLDFPFEGALRLQPDDFRTTLRMIAEGANS